MNINTRQPFFCHHSYETNHGQKDNEGFGPNRAVAVSGIHEHFEVVIPGMNMQRIIAGTVEISSISSKGIENSAGVGQK